MAHADLDQLIDVAGAQLDRDELDPASIVEGSPETFSAVLDETPDGRVIRGIWEITPGVVTDIETDELFSVVSGRATVTLSDGRQLELGPGSIGVFRAGEATTWRVHERLRKVFQITT